LFFFFLVVLLQVSVTMPLVNNKSSKDNPTP